MDVRKTGRLQAFIEARTTAKGAATHQEMDMAERLDIPVLDKAARVTQAAAKAVAKIKDPARKHAAQQLLDSLRKQETALHKAANRTMPSRADGPDFER